jgi:hypothetical protein
MSLPTVVDHMTYPPITAYGDAPYDGNGCIDWAWVSTQLEVGAGEPVMTDPAPGWVRFSASDCQRHALHLKLARIKTWREPNLFVGTELLNRGTRLTKAGCVLAEGVTMEQLLGALALAREP